ncbi:hypothetical protein [Ruminococcus sp. HUN007]|uniref:hypothetical protein n=1 Tax=Ruminococcus sp. HUN007 TaxID=1514668 RepID=UPI0005D29D2C|nr:hypothetical protein [Ruminococcus sp. HUN007]
MLNERIILYTEEAEAKGIEEGQALAFAILQTIISLKDESESDIIAALTEQYDLKENEAKKYIDKFNMISTCRIK